MNLLKFEENKEDLINSLIYSLIDLVKIKSLTGFEDNLKNYILNFIQNNTDFDKLHIYQKRNNVVVFNRELQEDKLIALVGHIDTVDNINEYNGKIIDNKLYGLGSSDMKAGIALMLSILKLFYNFKNLIWIFYDQEEGPYVNNGLNLIFNDLRNLLSKVKLAIILEPTNNLIELGCNGVMNLEVLIKGKSGHSARPYSYINPFYKLNKLLNRIPNFFSNEFKINLNQYGIDYPEQIIFRSNFTITDIRGMLNKSLENRFKNVVPEYVKINFNVRFTPDLEKQKVLKSIFSFLYDVLNKEEIIIKIIDYADSGKIIVNNVFQSFISFYLENYSGIKGIKAKEAWTDIATFTNNGISAINLGPGDSSLAHQKNEYIPIDNLIKLFDFFNTIISRSFHIFEGGDELIMD